MSRTTSELSAFTGILVVLISFGFSKAAVSRDRTLAMDVETLLLHQQQAIEDLQSQLEALSTRLRHKEERTEELEKAVKTLTALTRQILPRNCAGLQDLGLDENGLYFIDPDGPTAGQPPIEAFCDFSKGSTNILHDSMVQIEVEQCPEPGCFGRNLTYGPSDFQISNLVASSEYCLQRIEYNCYAAPLSDAMVDWAWWTGTKTGDRQNYWAGNSPGTHKCNCGLENNCVNPQLECNCDAKNPEWFQDAGYIAGNELPIKSVNFGGLAFGEQRANFTVGPLECFGKAPARVAQTCAHARMNGAINSGFYWVMPKGGEYKLTHCDLNFPTTEFESQQDTEIVLSHH